MPNPYPTELRERAVRAYESSSETYAMVASDFSVSEPTLQRWVRR
jgi:transposase-like protein